MPTARKHLVCVNATPYYHVTSRCVRRAFLCGVDRETGNSYEHRRDWIEQRIRILSSLFAVEICTYAVMSNHYHLVVCLRPDEARGWSGDQVLARWTALFRGPLLVQQYCEGAQLSPAEKVTLDSITAVYRKRLGSLSWFMKCLNEPIARKANAEDGCSGHFWEARFHSEALLSEQALVQAMAYVDLNPVRARVARTPERSAYTGIRARLHDRQANSMLTRAVARMLRGGALHRFEHPIRPLRPFFQEASSLDSESIDPSRNLPITRLDYLQLLDAAGRELKPGKRGKIDPEIRPVLQRLGLQGSSWNKSAVALAPN